MSAKSQLEAAIDRLKESSAQVNLLESSEKYSTQLDQVLSQYIRFEQQRLVDVKDLFLQLCTTLTVLEGRPFFPGVESSYTALIEWDIPLDVKNWRRSVGLQFRLETIETPSIEQLWNDVAGEKKYDEQLKQLVELVGRGVSKTDSKTEAPRQRSVSRVPPAEPLHANTSVISLVHKAAADIKLENQKPEASPVPWHPGAVKYFKEKGLKF